MCFRGYSCLALALVTATSAFAQEKVVNQRPGLQAHLRVPAVPMIPGQPVWVGFSIENSSDESVTLTVPGTEPAIPSPEMGLPLPHVFSGVTTPPIVLEGMAGSRWDAPLGFRRPDEAPILILAPHSSVGTTVDLREYYPALRGAGNYRITWQPYDGAAAAASANIRIETLKQAIITTDEGRMTLRFFYEDAPQTVANFIELATDRFYDGKTFHRLEPGYFILGGCPRGDGTGIRLDGKRVPAEFNDHPFRKGTVAMALLNDDPDSASSQFFICNTRQKEWDGKYTAFAELVGDESFETLDRLMAVPVNEQGRPERELVMRTVRVSEAPSDMYAASPATMP
ncbi:MAG: peptidylprolyl isomerase [Phycisphaerae bacterium]|nr:peptidylprolyl isomerase [Phycisphaerae bacterium]